MTFQQTQGLISRIGDRVPLTPEAKRFSRIAYGLVDALRMPN
jgi:hypothetical protein